MLCGYLLFRLLSPVLGSGNRRHSGVQLPDLAEVRPRLRGAAGAGGAGAAAAVIPLRCKDAVLRMLCSALVGMLEELWERLMFAEVRPVVPFASSSRRWPGPLDLPLSTPVPSPLDNGSLAREVTFKKGAQSLVVLGHFPFLGLRVSFICTVVFLIISLPFWSSQVVSWEALEELCLLASFLLVRVLLPELLLTSSLAWIPFLRLKLPVLSDALLWPSGTCVESGGSSSTTLLMQLKLPALADRTLAEARPSAVSFVLRDSLINVTIGSFVHRGRRPDSKYCTSSAGAGSWTEGGTGSGLRLSFEPKDQRRGNTLLRVSLVLLGALMLTLRP
ncbi:hypothetical protein EYF80_034502 [Liparis tanakae]|uniref:Uncharacterized protein n=1 Tax=Liparis tanakae TaxID=230148 RepID=A0A4Z2GP48_9TELE|nr:hypothetical protein EYF80_034502 [Liparis tanakae]